MMLCAYWESPLGWIEVCEKDSAVWSVDFTDDPKSSDDAPLLREAVAQLEEWFARERRDFTLPLCERGTSFQREVWEALRSVPYGETTTYGELAEKIGDRKKARAVGFAMSENPWLIVVPCHRVTPKSGGAGCYCAGSDRKQRLLIFEGVK